MLYNEQHFSGAYISLEAKDDAKLISCLDSGMALASLHGVNVIINYEGTEYAISPTDNEKDTFPMTRSEFRIGKTGKKFACCCRVESHVLNWRDGTSTHWGNTKEEAINKANKHFENVLIDPRMEAWIDENIKEVK